MNEDENYKAPESKLIHEEIRPPRDESHGRRSYVICLFLLFIVLPPLLSFVLGLIGIDKPSVQNIEYLNSAGESNSRLRLNMLEYWFLQIPIYIYMTRNRVKDAGLNAWFTVLFIFPVINLAMWFWPPKYK